jgi:adenylate cyclase
MAGHSPQKLSDLNLDYLLNRRFHGTPWQAFWQELWGNSGHFLILKTLSDIINDGWYASINDATDWVLIGAFALQSWCLTRHRLHHFWGNLVGPTLYTLVDLAADGWDFLESPSHLMLWGFCLAIALSQGLRLHWVPTWSTYLLPLESVIRTTMVWVAYLIATAIADQTTITVAYVQDFFTDTSHGFLLLALVFLGVLMGLQALQLAKQQQQTQETAAVLRDLAQWGMGDHVVTSAIANPDALRFQRVERALVFMDIRGFTAWCEAAPPERVAQILNLYYQMVEPAAAAHQPLRVSFTADEVMGIYPTLGAALGAAVAMRRAAQTVLEPEGLGAGCGLHYGPVVEGLFGSEGVWTYTAIGDTVNTAKRIEGATPAHELYLSEAAYRQLPLELRGDCQPLPPVQAKGKRLPVELWRWRGEGLAGVGETSGDG